MKTAERGARGVACSFEGGFTLIELIIVLVIVAVLATMLYSYFGTAITGSATPVARLGTALKGQQVMENITADYIANYSSNLAGLQINIGREGTNRNNAYGRYTVVDNHFMKWNGNTDSQVGSSNCLKVTVKDSLGETLTQIYTNGNQTLSCQ